MAAPIAHNSCTTRISRSIVFLTRSFRMKHIHLIVQPESKKRDNFSLKQILGIILLPHHSKHARMTQVTHQLHGALGILLFPIVLALFLLPGFAVALRVAASCQISRSQLLILVVTVSCTSGYLSFWAFFAAKPLGKVFSFASVLTAATSLVLDWKRRPYLLSAARSLSTPLLYVMGVGSLYLCLLYLFSNPLQAGVDLSSERFFSTVRPDDNLIPLIFAEKIYTHLPLRPFCCGDWLSSDRPPLQAGLSLFQHPLRLAGSVALNYQLLGTVLQCLWICGVWTLLLSLGASQTRVRQVLGLLVFSGFMFFNSVYTWPKLLAATFILFAVSILSEIVRENRPITNLAAILAALSLSLAWLSHPGSIFSLPSIAFIVVRNIRLFHWRQCALFATIFAAFALPWMIYQIVYDPPGNRLIKMHIAGVMPIDHRSSWQTIREAYAAQTFPTLLQHKWSNLNSLIGPEPLNGLGVIAFEPTLLCNRNAVEQTRIAQREYIWDAIGILNLGWLAMAALALRQKRPAIPHSGWLLAASLANLVLFSLALFGPNATVTTHCSYADILLISVGLAGYLLALPRMVILIGFALQILNLFVVWVWTSPVIWSLQIPEAIAALALTVFLSWHFGHGYFESPEA